jgi:6-phosphofructokinase 1
MQRLAVLTSGGDAPGMNAAIRAVARTGIARGWEVFGVRDGYSGLVEGRFEPLDARAVGGIVERGGTMLGSARCPEFREPATRDRALRQLARQGIDGLVVIGGNGSQTGSDALGRMGFPVVGVASTIDNDLYGTEMTIGVDTALNIALEAIDRLRVTAASHHRAFLVEVMGRDCGYLALMAGLAGGAEAVVIPEREIEPAELVEILSDAWRRGKQNALVVVAEGATYNANRLVAYFEAHRQQIGFPLRATQLGHVQRGGTPGAFDRLLGTRFGVAAANCIAGGQHGVLVGLQRGQIATTPLAEVVANKKQIDVSLLDLVKELAL